MGEIKQQANGKITSKMKPHLCIIIVLLISSCSVSKGDQKDWNKLIEGKWRLVPEPELLYPIIEFNKNEDATFYCLADTIFGFRYRLEKDKLWLHGEDITKWNRILKLTQDSLIFETLLRKTGIQRYVRTKTNDIIHPEN